MWNRHQLVLCPQKYFVIDLGNRTAIGTAQALYKYKLYNIWLKDNKLFKNI